MQMFLNYLLGIIFMISIDYIDSGLYKFPINNFKDRNISSIILIIEHKNCNVTEVVLLYKRINQLIWSCEAGGINVSFNGHEFPAKCGINKHAKIEIDKTNLIFWCNEKPRKFPYERHGVLNRRYPWPDGTNSSIYGWLYFIESGDHVAFDYNSKVENNSLYVNVSKRNGLDNKDPGKKTSPSPTGVSDTPIPQPESNGKYKILVIIVSLTTMTILAILMTLAIQKILTIGCNKRVGKPIGKPSEEMRRAKKPSSSMAETGKYEYPSESDQLHKAVTRQGPNVVKNI